MQIVKLNADMTVAQAKKEVQDMFETTTVKLTYLNNKGELKNADVEVIMNVEFFKDDYYENVILNEEKIMTGIGITIGCTHVKESYPEDYEKPGFSSFTGIGYGIKVACTGDITKTGEVDVTDLSTMQEYIVDNIELEEIQQVAADMNDDEDVDVVDLSEIQEYIVNN